MRKESISKIFWGVLVILIGLAFLMRNLGYISFNGLTAYIWQFIFLYFSVQNIFEEKYFDAIFWLVLSALFQLRSIGLIYFSSWPIFFSMLIILIGVKILFPRRRNY